MEAKIALGTLKVALDAISAFVDECRIHVQGSGLRTIAVDTANVAMVELELSTNAFISYGWSGPQEIGLDVRKLKRILTMANSGDEIELAVDQGDLKVQFRGYKYSLRLLDVNTIRKDPNPPALKLPARAVMSGSVFTAGIKAASIVSDKVALGIDPASKEFYMEAQGDTDHLAIRVPESDLVALDAVKARSLFSLDYLRDMAGVIAHATEVGVELGVDHPVTLAFKVADDTGTVKYLLAPRIF
ncbi:MAG: DNA polymerase sliding clamp [Methanomicrobiaceae archaeon]|nr:DNA polymerase sliding clamp [Methanomicrobiaceae archaeon]